jgi:DNA repair protein RecO (recombination protein O)
MPAFVVESVILRSADFQERDRLVTLYSDQMGKLRGVAKGAKASRKRFGANLDLLAHVRVHGFERTHQGLVRIEGADILDYYDGIRRELRSFAFASYLAEWVDGCTAERQPLPGLLPLLLRVLTILEERKGGEGLLRIFEVKVLDLAGYRPRLDRCVTCGGPLEGTVRINVHVERGGALCRNCARGPMEGLSISLGTLRALDDARRAPLDRLHRIAFSSLAVKEGRDVTQSFYQYHVGRVLRSGEFLETLG